MLTNGFRAHATSALNDPTGHSGRALGIQLEFRAQYRFMPRLSGAVGGAFLSPGDYLEDAPARTHSPRNTRYVYAEATLRFRPEHQDGLPHGARKSEPAAAKGFKPRRFGKLPG